MFTQQELSGFHGVLQHTEEFVEVDCGCTNPKYGDTPGKLRVYLNGKIEINCTCGDHCPKVNLSPVAFAKHAGRINSHIDSNWKNMIWVFSHTGEKIALRKTCLLRHHTEDFQRPLRQAIHRDEFKTCSRCCKLRRFTLRDREACRVYHDAMLDDNWECSDMPDQSLSCGEGEERECRKGIKGCPKVLRCEGCAQCVCLGCEMCRFEDCDCRTCVEFILNM